MEPNPEYPNQKPEDFVDFYDAETSDIPWRTDENCHICGRIRDAFNPVYSHWSVLYCPFRRTRIHYHTCSSLCVVRLNRNNREEFERYMALSKKGTL